MVPQEVLTDGKRWPAWLLQTALRGQAHGQGAATKGLARSQGTATREPKRGRYECGTGRVHEAPPPEGERMVETLPHNLKGSRKLEALP